MCGNAALCEVERILGNVQDNPKDLFLNIPILSPSSKISFLRAQTLKLVLTDFLYSL